MSGLFSIFTIPFCNHLAKGGQMYRISLFLVVLIILSAFVLLNGAYISMHMATYRPVRDTAILAPDPFVSGLLLSKR
jgi:hypothetical protein